MKGRLASAAVGAGVALLVWVADGLLIRPVGRYQLVQAPSHAPMRLDTRTGELRVFLDGQWKAIPGHTPH